MRHKNNAVRDFLCFLNGGGNLCFIENVDHVFFALSCAGVVCSVCIVEKGNFNPVYFPDFYRSGIFFCLMDTKQGNVGIIGTPEFKGLRHIVIAVVVNMICGGFHYVKACLYNSVSHFCRRCKRRIGAYGIVICCKNGFLVDHGNVRALDFVQDILINVVIVPLAGIVFSGVNKALMIKIVSYCNDGGCCDNWRSGCLFRFFFFKFCFSFRFDCRFLYYLIVQLVEKQAKNRKYGDGADETDLGVHSLLKIKGYIFISFHGNVLCIFNDLSGIFVPVSFIIANSERQIKLFYILFKNREGNGADFQNFLMKFLQRKIFSESFFFCFSKIKEI